MLKRKLKEAKFRKINILSRLISQRDLFGTHCNN